MLQQRGEGVFAKELLDRRTDRAGLVDLDVGQALGTVLGGVRGVFVDLLARQRSATGDAQRGDAAICIVGSRGEHDELAGLHQFRHVHQFQRDAQVRLVRTKSAHGLGPGHAREFSGQFHLHDVAEDRADHVFGGVLDVAFADEGEFHIELCELELAVGAQRFVTEAARDLVVAIEAGHHQDLLEQLRRLRQRVELARMHARRHQEVARAFRRGLGQDGGFDVLEITRVQPLAQRGDQLGAGAHHALHLGAAQVQVAVFQSRFFARIFMGVERQRFGLVEDGDFGRHHFHLAAFQLVVDAVARTHHAFDLQHVLVTQAGGDLEDFHLLRLHQHLHDAVVVAQVDEATPPRLRATSVQPQRVTGWPVKASSMRPQKWVRMGKSGEVSRRRCPVRTA